MKECGENASSNVGIYRSVTTVRGESTVVTVGRTIKEHDGH